MKGRVMAAMSGGVDSAVAAWLLKNQGYEVTGVTMCLGVEAKETGKVRCCGPREIEDARGVCTALGIGHYILDFAHELKSCVIDPFIREYAAGRTPNPCIECNRHIKFGSLLRKAMAMEFDYLATGHYAGIKKVNGNCCPAVPKDSRKDQTYFLSGISGDALEHVLFPLADLTKEQVREIAAGAGLPVSSKKESQDICFIPSGGTNAFLEHNIDSPPGDVVDIRGKIMGRHRGIANYTIGQRARMSMNWGRPLYVISKDVRTNTIMVGERDLLLSRGLLADSNNFFTSNILERAHAKIRYAHTPAACSITVGDGAMTVLFDEPQEAVTPGQTVALYDSGIVLGSGIIRSTIP